MDKSFCDADGNILEPYDGYGMWQIDLHFISWWNLKGDKRSIKLCGSCGSKVANFLGFQYDTGKILSIACKDTIDSVSVFGPHGGGFEDIAVNGVTGANIAKWHSAKPDALIASHGYWLRHKDVNFRDD